ncbi:MAG TPA: glycosyltransferase [Bacteroidales bacterium]|nr:glycosyltransferase [Bacteroidales bacterium]
MSICIAYPNKNLSFSETFISNHLKFIEHKSELTGGYYPYLTIDRNSIFQFPLSIDLLRGGIKNIAPKVYKRLYTLTLSDYLLKTKPSVVLAEYGVTGSMMTDACKKTSIPLVTHFHGFDAHQYKILEQYKDDYQKMFDYARTIIVVSEDMKKELIQIGADEHKIVNLPYGVDINKFSGANPENSAPIFIFVGRLTHKKSPINLIKAFKIVADEIDDARLVIVGDGELKKQTLNEIETLNLSAKVELKGVLSPLQVAEELKKARCFVQHSVRDITGDSEGTPNTILEASGSGLPIISTTHAGIKEAVVHGHTGLLCAEHDYKAMGQNMLTIAKDKQLAAQMGIKAREHISKNYNIETQMEKLRQLLY